MPRKNPETSMQAYERIMQEGARETTYRKIINSLETIGEGNYEKIAFQANERESRIWKRLCDLRNMGIIFDTGKRILTQSKCNSMVYALFPHKEKYVNVKPPERMVKHEISAADYACAILAKSKKPIQPRLF